jgi:D-glycero-D-manno-heptose 1,7-bisphosphate phosphatase
LLDIGLYRRTGAPLPHPLPALFVDRDGVIVEETNYLHRIDDVQVIAGSAQAIARVNAAGIPVVEVTNQAGVGRSYYTWREFEEVQAHIEAELAKHRAHLDGVWACGYHPDGVGALRADHWWRKPHPGMLHDAAETLSLDMQRSWMVGDKILDLEAGCAAGLTGLILVRTGYGATHEARLESVPLLPHQQLFVADDLSCAIDRLLKDGRL